MKKKEKKKGGWKEMRERRKRELKEGEKKEVRKKRKTGKKGRGKEPGNN